MAKYRIPSDYENQTPRATHKRVAPVYGTIHPGLAIPVHHRHLNVGERIRGSIEQLVQSEPMRGPLMNGFRLTAIATFLPDSAIYGWLRNGRRFNPDQYMNFSKVHFQLAGTNLGSYTDPEFGLSRKLYRVYPGLRASSAGDLTPYDLWESDMFSPLDSNPLRHVGRGGLWDWLGLPAGAVCPNLGSTAAPSISSAFKLSIAPFFTYLLSHYYYIANMQEDYMYFTRGLGELSQYSNPTFDSHFSFQLLFSSLPMEGALDILDDINKDTSKGVGFDVFTKYPVSVSSQRDAVYGMVLSGLQAYGGLLSVPYSPDLFGNIIRQGSSPSVNIPVIDDPDQSTGYAVGVPELRLQTKIQNWMDRLFVSGGRVGDVFRTLWGKKSSPYVNKPDFLGVWQSSVNPSNTVAMANGTADGESMNVGQMAARVDRWCDYPDHSKIDYYANEPGTFMIIVMLTPQPAYCQGLHPDLFGTSFADDYNPELNGVGFQSVPRHRFSMMPNGFSSFPGAANTVKSQWFDNGAPTSAVDPLNVSLGETVAWDWLRTDYARLHGEFAQNGNRQYWTLVRRFSEYYVDSNANHSDYHYFGTYINPLDWQYLFVGQSFATPNFQYYGYFDLKVTSSVSAHYMPYLGR